MVHTSVLTDVNNANDKQQNEPVDEEADHTFQKGDENDLDKEYIKLEMYENDESEALFALADELVNTILIVNLVVDNDVDGHRLTKEVCMHKVKVLAFKETLVCLVLKALNKECLVMWVEVNVHKAWTL
ncbi:hypothetical protein C0995_002656 [Termitomyces sp. Mi166|nr:hypothetical protein C0995_002656 [Termitomyces sp. Mi166\